MGARVLMVGWDSADPDLIERWTAEGRLPTLARLRANGRWRAVESAAGFGDHAAWSSFSTGVELGVHARGYWQRIAPDGHRVRFHPRDEMTHPPFWEELAGSGHRVAVIDVPSSPIGEATGALVVADWMAHSLERPEVLVTWPSLARRFVRDPDWVCDVLDRDAEQTQEYERALLERAARRTDVLVDLLSGDEWDLFVAVVAEPHCVGHQCWHDHDPSHAEHDPARRAACGDPLEAVYRDADAQLARLLDAAGPDATVVVFSLLGMGSNDTGEHLLDEVLRRLDGSPSRRSARLRAFDLGRRIVPAGLRRRVPGRVRTLQRDAVTSQRARRSAWTIPTDLATSAIRIGVVGRDDGGTVEPGEPLAAVRTRLRSELLDLEDPENGRPVVADVTDVGVAHGPRAADAFADLMVTWTQDGPISGVRSPAIGTVRGTPPPLRTGNHRSRGWAVVGGGLGDLATVPDPVVPISFAALVADLLAHVGRGAHGVRSAPPAIHSPARREVR